MMTCVARFAIVALTAIVGAAACAGVKVPKAQTSPAPAGREHVDRADQPRRPRSVPRPMGRGARARSE